MNHVISFDGGGGMKIGSPGKEQSGAANSARRSNRTRSARELQGMHDELFELQCTFLEAGRRTQQRKLLKVQLNKLEADIRLKYFEFEEDLVLLKQQQRSTPAPPAFVPPMSPRRSMPDLPRPPASPGGSPVPQMGGSELEVAVTPGSPAESPFHPEDTTGSLKVASHITDTHCWTSSPSAIYEIRTANYLKKKKKYTPQDSMFELVGADAFTSSQPSSQPGTHWEDSVYNRAKRNHAATGEPMPRYLIVTFMCPVEPQLIFSLYFAEKPLEVKTEEDKAYKRLVDHFLTGDNDKFRKSRFKLIPQCAKGPWVVKKAMGSPALIAKKLDTKWFRGDGFLEVSVDVGSSMIAKRILGTVTGSLAGLVLDLGFTIEGKTAEELPERLLGGVRLQHIDLGKVSPLDGDGQIVRL